MRDQANNNDFYLINSYQYGSTVPTFTSFTTEYPTARSYMIKMLMNRAILRLQIFITDMNVSVSIFQILCIAAHVPVFFFFLSHSLSPFLSLSLSWHYPDTVSYSICLSQCGGSQSNRIRIQQLCGSGSTFCIWIRIHTVRYRKKRLDWLAKIRRLSSDLSSHVFILVNKLFLRTYFNSFI